MIELKKYKEKHKAETIGRMVDFFDFHKELICGSGKIDKESLDEAEKTLSAWCGDSNELYIIKSEEASVGFLHIGFRSDIVAWIEDIYVDKAYRGKGIATRAIYLAEEIIRTRPGYKAVCFDVVPRNEAALRLYYKLGYDSLSLITVRKELGENKRNRHENVFGLDFKY